MAKKTKPKVLGLTQISGAEVLERLSVSPVELWELLSVGDLLAHFVIPIEEFDVWAKQHGWDAASAASRTPPTSIELEIHKSDYEKFNRTDHPFFPKHEYINVRPKELKYQRFNRTTDEIEVRHVNQKEFEARLLTRDIRIGDLRFDEENILKIESKKSELMTGNSHQFYKRISLIRAALQYLGRCTPDEFTKLISEKTDNRVSAKRLADAIFASDAHLDLPALRLRDLNEKRVEFNERTAQNLFVVLFSDMNHDEFISELKKL